MAARQPRPPWDVTGPPLDSNDVRALDMLLSKSDAELARPDGWLSPNGRRVSRVFVPGWFPLRPGRVMLEKGTVAHQFHPEIYVGDMKTVGVAVRFFRPSHVRLLDLALNQHRSAKKWLVAPVSLERRTPADARAVLRRARAALGQFQYALFGNNCQHVGWWIMTNSFISPGVRNALPLTIVSVLLVVAIVVVAVMVARACRRARS